MQVLVYAMLALSGNYIRNQGRYILFHTRTDENKACQRLENQYGLKGAVGDMLGVMSVPVMRAFIVAVRISFGSVRILQHLCGILRLHLVIVYRYSACTG